VHTVSLAPGEPPLPPATSMSLSEDGKMVTIHGDIPPGFVRNVIVKGSMNSKHFRMFGSDSPDDNQNQIEWDERGVPIVPTNNSFASLHGRSCRIITPQGTVTYEAVMRGHGPRTIDVRAGGYRFRYVHNGHEWSAVGANSTWQLGIVEEEWDTAYHYPVRNHFSHGLTFDTIACGNEHVAAIVAGNVFTWGHNSSGELGHGVPPDPFGQIQRRAPQLVNGLDDGNVVSVRCSRGNTAAIKRDGSAWVAGRTSCFPHGIVMEFNRFNAYDPMTGQNVRWKSISITRTRHGLGIDTNGRVWSWGTNISFSTGQGVGTGSTFPPRLVALNGSGNAPVDAPIEGAIEVFTSSQHDPFQHNSFVNDISMVLLSNGTLLSWGLHPDGAHGHGLNVLITVPTSIGTGFTQVSHYEGHTIALKDTKLFRWGSNAHGECFTGYNPGFPQWQLSPVPVPTQFGNHDWSYVTSHLGASYAIRSDGTLWVAGVNLDFRLNVWPDEEPEFWELIVNLTQSSTYMFEREIMSIAPSYRSCFFKLRVPSSITGSVVQTEDDIDPLLVSDGSYAPTHVVLTLGLTDPDIVTLMVDGREITVPTAESVDPGEDGVTLEGGEIMWTAADWGDDGEAQALYDNAIVRRASVVGGGIPPPPVTNITMRVETPGTPSPDPEPVVVTSPSTTFPPVDQPVQPPAEEPSAEEPSAKEWYEGVVFIVLVSIASFILVVSGSVFAWRRAHRAPRVPTKTVE